MDVVNAVVSALSVGDCVGFVSHTPPPPRISGALQGTQM